jgi:8-hydroxy-5-deazaflavin:NADPH oxidoreductase
MIVLQRTRSVSHAHSIIGAGNVGCALGQAWSNKGHEVTYGVRDAVKAPGPGASLRVNEAAAAAEVIVLAVMFHAVESALHDCGDLAGKILIDPTNPLAREEGGLRLSMGYETSSAEFIASRTAARVVKTLNQVGARVLGDASGYPIRPLQFVAGDDAQAKQVVKRLVEELGFEVLDAGPLTAARLLEPLAMVWINQAMRYGMDPNRAWASVPRRN